MFTLSDIINSMRKYLKKKSLELEYKTKVFFFPNISFFFISVMESIRNEKIF